MKYCWDIIIWDYLVIGEIVIFLYFFCRYVFKDLNLVFRLLFEGLWNCVERFLIRVGFLYKFEGVLVGIGIGVMWSCLLGFEEEILRIDDVIWLIFWEL